MPRKDHARERLDLSAEAMLAEHERLSDLYLSNADLGEKRTSLLLTLLSAGSVVLLGVAQFGVDAALLWWPSIGLLAVILIVGALTFQRLIERRIRGREYLRAINRIHRYFVEQDPALEPYFYWPPCDDTSFLGGRGSAATGLRDVVALLNSLFAGVLIGVSSYTLWPAIPLAIHVLFGVVGLALVMFAHNRYELWQLRRAEGEAQDYVRFPHLR